MTATSEVAQIEERRSVRGVTIARETALVWAIVGLGIIARVVRFAHNRSLWGDEARLSLNLRDRTFDGLLHPLDYVQAAPTGFLLAEKAVISAFGDSEYALRLLPLLAGVVSLVLFMRLSRLLLPVVAASIATAIFALTDPLVYYSSEVKQYSFDVLATVALLSLAAPPLLTRTLTRRRAIVLLAAGAVAFWFSHPSIFVAAAIWIVLTVVQLRHRRAAVRELLLVGVAWLAVFGASYALVLRNASNVSAALGLNSSSSHTSVIDIARDAWHSFAYPVGFAYTATALAATMTAVGIYVLVRRAPVFAAAMIATVAATALGALAGKYPFYDRFVLFLVPIVILAVAAGLEGLREAPTLPARAAFVASAALLVAYPALQGAKHVASPPPHEEIKPVLVHMAQAWEPGDALYVSTVAQYALRYYAECNDCGVLDGRAASPLRTTVLDVRGGNTALHSQMPTVEVGNVDFGTPFSVYVSDFARMRGQQRAWFLFTSTFDPNEIRLSLGCMGHLVDSSTSVRAAAYLYDLTARPDLGRGECPG
ncbi:MAG TPA: hypothetical protein VFA56_08155 [Gaiellaceae bacterium]|nr:hypothetical protein [Gaiellaceae bacterium]